MEQQKEVEVADLLASSLLFITKLFNDMVTEGASRSPDFPTENLPSVKYPQFVASLDVVPLLLEKFIALRAQKLLSEDLSIIYMKTVAVSQSMAANDAFSGFRIAAQDGLFFIDSDKQEQRAVNALATSFLVRNTGVKWKLVKSSFSPHGRPKAENFKDDQQLQLIFRIYMYTTARWYGADQAQAMRIFEQHLRVSWVMVMSGLWKEALEDLDKHERLRRV